MLGVAEIDDGDVDLDDSFDAEVESVSQTLPLLGAAVQYPIWGGPRVQLGFEGGSTISWDRDTTRVFLNSGTVIVRADNNILLADLFGGLSLNANLGRDFRAWAGIGPLLQYGRVDLEYDDAGSEVDVDDSGFGAGVYARAGIDYEFKPNNWVGLSIRHVDSELNLSGDFDDFELETTQLVLVVSIRY